MNTNAMHVGLRFGVMVTACGLVACAQTMPLAPHVMDRASVTAPGPTLELSKAEAMALSTVKPPLKPQIVDAYSNDASLNKLAQAVQPEVLTKVLLGLQEGGVAERKNRLKAKVWADMVHVRGGTFMMGDFAKLMGVEGAARMTYNEDDKHVHEVTLSDFWISKYKATHAEFDVFSDDSGQPRNGMEFDGKNRSPLTPVGAYWQQAKDYCQWLGRLMGIPMDLPTEAQWEYAARSRGQFFMVGTDDGNLERGRNVPDGQQDHLFQNHYRAMGTRYPVGMYPPNPLGLFDMSHNGEEWVSDWYAVDAYARHELLDPHGPSSGVKKVTRSWGADDFVIGVNVWRRAEDPSPVRGFRADGTARPLPTLFSPTVRCVGKP